MAKTFAEELAEKITNEHHFHVVLKKHGYDTTYGHCYVNGKSYTKPWWAHREQMRLENNVYQVTPPIQYLNESLPLFIHVSKDDPTRVAHTPDKAFGERDAQLVISIGKLLTRFYPALRDEAIQEIVSEHKADLSLEVEFIEHDGIAAAYRQFGSLGACMSKSADHFGGHNPAIAYDAPGIRLAVLRSPEGAIIERSLVVEMSADDKRYIRCYPPGSTLQKRLQKRGYEAGGWNGVKFNVVPIGDHEGRPKFVFPYLDGNGVLGSADWSSIALIDNEIVGVTSEHARSLKKVQLFGSTCATSTSGWIALTNIATADYNVIDFFTKEPISKLTGSTYTVRVNGVNHSTKQNLPQGWVLAVTQSDEKGRHNVYMMEEETIYLNYQVIDKSKAVELGFSALDVEWYGTDRFVSKESSFTTLSGRVIKRSDAIKYVTDDGCKSGIHKSELVLTGKQKDIKLSTEYYARHDTKLYYTPSGRKIHPLVHNVVLLWDGMYDFARNAVHVEVLGKFYYVPKDLMIPTGEGSAVWTQRVAEVAELSREARATSGLDENCSSLSAMAHEVYYQFTTRNFGAYGGRYREERITTDEDLPIAAEMDRIRLIGKTIGTHQARATLSVIEVEYAQLCAEEAPLMYVSPLDTSAVIELPEIVVQEMPDEEDEIVPVEVAVYVPSSVIATTSNGIAVTSFTTNTISITGGLAGNYIYHGNDIAAAAVDATIALATSLTTVS